MMVSSSPALRMNAFRAWMRGVRLPSSSPGRHPVRRMRLGAAPQCGFGGDLDRVGRHLQLGDPKPLEMSVPEQISRPISPERVKSVSSPLRHAREIDQKQAIPLSPSARHSRAPSAPCTTVSDFRSAGERAHLPKNISTLAIRRPDLQPLQQIIRFSPAPFAVLCLNSFALPFLGPFTFTNSHRLLRRLARCKSLVAPSAPDRRPAEMARKRTDQTTAQRT
jgi:hypothetical protein